MLFVKNLDIHEFETRVKRYADLSAMGNITQQQLMLGFRDLKTFNQLQDNTTVLHKLIYSPFVSKLNPNDESQPVGGKYNYFSVGAERPSQSEISVNSLLLMGILRCRGSYKDKAEVFQRVVQPEGQRRIMITDKDIRLALYFMTSLATILQMMQNQMVMDDDD